MKCPQCQHDNADSQKFCGECGARLVVACPACQAVNPPTNKFCGECGGRLGDRPAAPTTAPAAAATQPAAAAPSPPAAIPETPVVAASAAVRSRFESPAAYTPQHLADKILTSKSAVEGERKQVTVMFTDVSGFTAMSEALDPEDVHAIMDRVFEIVLGAVHECEGTINQFLGDGVMALFGAPIAHEDHAYRAVRAALAIQDGLVPLRDDVRRTYGKELWMRIGINTGLVVVGAIGRDLRMDYTAIGDTTNLASRLLNVAQPGQIVLSAVTQRACEGFFDFEDLGTFQVKGKTEPVRAYAARTEIKGRTRLEVSKQRGLTPMVGRRAERERLDAAFAEVRGGRGRVVTISGEPGVGKSRLLYEFLRTLGPADALELEATCVSYGRSIPYRPILDLVRRSLDLPEGAAAPEVRDRAASGLRAVAIDDDDARILLAHFLGVPAPPDFLGRVQGALLRQRTTELLRELFCRQSARRPLVTLVENLHWVDASSEEFLTALAATVSRHAILLLLTTRPGEPMTWLPEGTETITLEGLGAGDLRQMVQSLLGARVVSDSLFELLMVKGEGNPLYIEEIVRQLQETDGIRLEDGEAALKTADVTIPGTIHDIISARVDRIAEPFKQTLQVGAVIGRRFGVPLVSHVLHDPGSDVATRLSSLHALDFVFPIADPPETMYSFKHALTQDVVYSNLLERRRRRYHAAVGEGLELLYAGKTDEVVELLAHHFERSADAEKAVDYAIQAAEKAQRRWANAEALTYFEAALKRLDTMPDTESNRRRRIDAVVKQAEVKFALGRHAEHVAALEKIRDLVDASADPPRRASWYYWAGFLHSLIGSPPEVAIAYCREARAIAEPGGFEEIRAYAECVLAHVLMTAGDLRGAIDAGERALASLEARGNLWWASRALWALSPVANALGEWERGLTYCRRALDHGRAVNDLRLKVVGWWRTGSTHIQRGDFAAGLQCLDEAQALSPIPFDLGMMRANLGFALVKKGDPTSGVAELGEAVKWFSQSNLQYTRSLFSLWLAEGQLCLGRADEARATLEEVVRTSRENGYRHLEGVAERLLAETWPPHDPAASAHLAVAIEILTAIAARNELAKALVGQAACEGARGDATVATELLHGAQRLFAELDTVDGPPLVSALLDVLEARGRLDAASGPVTVRVSRDQPQLFRVLARQFASDPRVRVVAEADTTRDGAPQPYVIVPAMPG